MWALTHPLTYTGKEDCWEVPKGFSTDFATIPRFLQGLITSDGPWNRSAILHDYFCAVGIQANLISSRDADAVFRRTMREGGVPFLTRWVMWVGVRTGALFNPVRRPGILRDVPLMLVWSIFAAPVVLPIGLITLLALLGARVVDWVLRVLCRLS